MAGRNTLNVLPSPTWLDTSIHPWCCLDDAIDRCQTQPRAFANFLGGEERLENAGQNLRGDPGARVADHADRQIHRRAPRD